MPQQTAHYLKDYHAPEYLVPHIRLNFDVYEDHTAVTAELSIQPQPDAGGTLVLQGSAELVSLELNGQRLPETADKRFQVAFLRLPRAASIFRLRRHNMVFKAFQALINRHQRHNRRP